MEYKSERIVNIAELEEKIRSARACADSVLMSLQNGNAFQAEYLARKLALALHELTEFEFVLEQRKTVIKDSE